MSPAEALRQADPSASEECRCRGGPFLQGPPRPCLLSSRNRLHPAAPCPAPTGKGTRSPLGTFPCRTPEKTGKCGSWRIIVGPKAAVWGRDVQRWPIINNVRSRVLHTQQGGPHRAAVLSSSSAIDNDSCGVEADTKHNDTDPCWGPLRRVDVYHIYLVSGLASAPQPAPSRPGWPGPFEPPSLSGGTVSPESRICASPHSA